MKSIIKKLKRTKLYFLAAKMHLSIVWGRWYDYEDNEGNIHKTYIDWSTDWTVSKGVWLSA